MGERGGDTGEAGKLSCKVLRLKKLIKSVLPRHYSYSVNKEEILIYSDSPVMPT